MFSYLVYISNGSEVMHSYKENILRANNIDYIHCYSIQYTRPHGSTLIRFCYNYFDLFLICIANLLY